MYVVVDVMDIDELDFESELGIGDDVEVVDDADSLRARYGR